MKLETALAMIHAPKGVTSIIAGLMSGDTDPIKGVEPSKSLADIEAKLAKTQEAQNNCGSDWAFWGYEGDISYLKAIRDILKAAAICGEDSLPDIEPLRVGGVVMDQCSYIMDFGRRMLIAAKKTDISSPVVGN